MKFFAFGFHFVSVCEHGQFLSRKFRCRGGESTTNYNVSSQEYSPGIIKFTVEEEVSRGLNLFSPPIQFSIVKADLENLKTISKELTAEGTT